MTVLVVGASSQLGLFFLPLIVATGRDVVALSRTPRADEAGVRWVVGELDQMPAEVGTLPGFEAIISFGPLDGLARWLAGATVAGTPHVIATSSMSAKWKQNSSVASDREIAARLNEGEALLAESCAARGMPWTVLRPALIYGAGMDKSLSRITQHALARRVFPLPAARGLRQPVHARDVAQAALAALERPQARNRMFEIGGGEQLTTADMFRRLRRSLPVFTWPVPIPRLALALAARCIPSVRGAISRLDSDQIADNADAIAILGVHPQRFAPVTFVRMVPVGKAKAST
ncbi:nucleoside-diphosphate-sugar epimerase [Luteibacter sp. Sphag1AF]|uniref:SDR family oxidoreductase n=1 Tax=Luteibacter sp. Sphag1AF TaxID=2587031 RepID=UPI0016117984|nr:NAD-dependent epimerase/dehydratase family protein [Luteibacter sp. Sphag1AF]MBB3225492.1 nucleoside-diphosphate-sugar epimerase [Luteibacter sp. Sphag1AF]